ncbi:MAG: DUF512 domain-containing protein [Ruminiclostridium sp.]|nr:DUF512 domain-containing protein [Ruminiclostridium sp.]
MSKFRISQVVEGSIADEAGIEPGDTLVSINGQNITDIFDYHFLTTDEEVLIDVEKPDGEILRVDIEKDESEDVGLLFDNPLLDEEKSCRNNCIFCFIDQLPKDMRNSLYYKDDDARLSFLFGNYITMTNMQQEDLDRIIKYRMSPVNISIHTTNPELRAFMLKNRFAGDGLQKMKYLADNGITINAQIVLCKGINDGLELDRTLKDLSALMPVLNSISVVPVGLTRFREGLTELTPYDRQSAAEVISQVEGWQNYFLEKTNSRRVYLADEWYLASGKKIPDYEGYEDFPQIENGVGMVASLVQEFMEAISDEKKRDINRTVSIACGTLVYSVISELAQKAEKYFRGLKVLVYPITNYFFGETVTVTGLLTGKDIKTQLKGKSLGEKLLLSENLFRAGTEVFLDDIELKELSMEIETKVIKVKCSGDELLQAVIN